MTLSSGSCCKECEGNKIRKLLEMLRGQGR